MSHDLPLADLRFLMFVGDDLRRPRTLVSQAAADRSRGAGHRRRPEGRNSYRGQTRLSVPLRRRDRPHGGRRFRRRRRSRRLHARQAAPRRRSASSSCATSPKAASSSPRSATAAGFRFPPASIAACTSPARPASKTTWSTPARSGRTPPSWSTATSSPAASRTICPTSAARSSK